MCIRDRDTTDTPAQSEEQKVEDTASPTESPAKEDTANTGELPKEETQSQTKEVTTMEIKTITEQEIGTDIFFEGQTGGYKANDNNKSFRAAAEKVGYIEADRFIMVSLDAVSYTHLDVYKRQILSFDFYMLEELCKIMRSWLDQGLEVVPISINQSGLHIGQDNYINDFCSVVDKYARCV